MSKNQHADDLKEIIQKIEKAAEGGEYIYRGEEECFDLVSSALYRRYQKNIQDENFDYLIAQKEMLGQAKKYTDFTDEEDTLAELQHFGGKTNLIDFTTDYRVALFFACDGAHKECGRVVLLDKASSLGPITFPRKNKNHRMTAQKSVFFQSENGYIPEGKTPIVYISGSLKEPMLNYLEKHHGISRNTIYPDLLGFIQHQDKYESAYVAFYLGIACQKNGEYKKVIEHLDNAIKISPQFAMAYVNRAAAKGELGRHKAAIDDCDEAIRLDPKDPMAYANRAAAKSALGRHEEAIEDCDEAIRLDPKNATAYANRAVAKSALGRHKAAIDDCDEAIRLDPKNATAYANRAAAKGALGRHKAAIDDCDEAIRLDPKDPMAYANRAAVKNALGRHEAAIDDCDEAIRLDPKNAMAYVNRAEAELSLGRHEAAIEDCDEAIRLDPKNATAYVNRAAAKLSLGRHEAAIEDCDKAIEINPQFAMAYAIEPRPRSRSAAMATGSTIRLDPKNATAYGAPSSRSAATRKRSRTATRRSASIRKMRRPTPTEAGPRTRSAATQRSRTATRRSARFEKRDGPLRSRRGPRCTGPDKKSPG